MTDSGTGTAEKAKSGGNDNDNLNLAHAHNKSWSLIKLLDENLRYIQYPFYAVGCIGLFFVIRSLRLGKKFTSVDSIPTEFFQKNFTLYGTLKEVKKFDGRKQSIVVLVDHTPIFQRRRHSLTQAESLTSEKLKTSLELNVPGVTVMSEYFPDLDSKLSFKRVAFTLLPFEEKDNHKFARCLLFVRERRLKVFPKYENVGFWCIQNGFGSVEPLPYPSKLRDSKIFTTYYEKLLELQKKAEAGEKGMWKGGEEDSRHKMITWLKKLVTWFKNWRS